ncbi:MAG: enoyl-CoA hydratase/isomerase family protein [Ignavibacteria bacterium]|nr:enoyl-CoA hydratase/isomerase family protein [Ignavibacteria bacterium]MBI3765596.1 enoyl-CoA hydratase/isomerase family protein [Ignavibacteriales bacterium]
MNFQTILLNIKDRLCTVTINRPDKLNALNARCKSELKDVFTNLRTNPDVDVVIITGSGEKAFVAGTDIGELTTLNAQTGKEFAIGGQAIFDLIQHLGKPVIAAVNGYALGGGCELALACHIRIASENAKFGQPEVNLGIIPGYGGTQRLARLVGVGRAMEMILTGNQIDAQEALRIGLVNKVVPLAELSPTSEAIARTILSKGQLAIRMAIKAVNATMEVPLSEGLKIEAAIFGECCSTDDFKEGTQAFTEKRKAVFKGK